MKQEFVRLKSTDNIEMPGILSSPEGGSDTIVLHVHGLNGNFYENRFLDALVDAYTSKGYAFLAFNNRGRDFLTELLQGDEFVVIGGCKERFKDCLLDLDGAVEWAKNRGYTKIILSGHSYGCNKVAYYYAQRKDPAIQKIVLMAPCDIPEEPKHFLGEEEYAKVKADAERCIAAGDEDALIDYSVMGDNRVAAGTFYHDFLAGGENDFFRYVDGADGVSEVLKSIDVPVLVVFGTADECMKTQPVDIVTGYLTNNIRDLKIEIIDGASHTYRQKNAELSNVIKSNF